MNTQRTFVERCLQFLASLSDRPPQGGSVLYIVIGLFCMVIGYTIGFFHHVHELESEIRLRQEWESVARGLVRAAAEYDGVVKNSTQQTNGGASLNG